MKIFLGETGLNQSWKKPFDKTIKCSQCFAEARIMFVAKEERNEKELVCQLRKNGGALDFWPNGPISVAVYLCKDCFSAEAIINQEGDW